MKILKKFQKLSKPVRIAIVALVVFIVAEIITVSSLSSTIEKNASSYAPSAQAETLPAQTITISDTPNAGGETSNEQTDGSGDASSSNSEQNSNESNSSASSSSSSSSASTNQAPTQNSTQSQNSSTVSGPNSSSNSSPSSSSNSTLSSNSSSSSSSNSHSNSNSGSTQSQPSTSAQSQQSQTTAKDPMSGIKIAEAENVPYDRKAYQPSWDVGSGCNIRARILQSTSIVNYTTSNGCTVTYGSWNDPYTGKVLTGNPYQGDGTANDLDIDHVIPLNYANSHGGYYWSAAAKRAYGSSLTGMNNGVYLAVSSSENRKKSDKGPASYYPPNPAYRCTYAKKWRDLARLYQISLSAADYNVVKNVLISCNIN